MTYQEILQIQFERRLQLNPRYSLRAFAKFLAMPPSKLSEVLNQKRGISLQKAQEIGKRLSLSRQNLEIFILSAQSQHARSSNSREKAKVQLKVLLQEKATKKSRQRTAWYFGAISTLIDAGITADKILSQILGITLLQVENAKRFLKRIKKLHPDVTDINYEPDSVFKKVQELHISRQDLFACDTDFALLTESELKLLAKDIQRILKKKRSKKVSGQKHLYLLNFTSIQLTEGDDLC